MKKFWKTIIKIGGVAANLFVKNPQRNSALNKVLDLSDPLVDSLPIDKEEEPTIKELVKTLKEAGLTSDQIYEIVKARFARDNRLGEN